MLKKLLPFFLLPLLLCAESSETSFTGKITSNRVRVRTQPNLTSNNIWKELNKGDLVVITGEKEDFYSILPPPGTKAYIFRTYVLDNHVEGDRVNVRLTPDVDAPVIAQLNHGDSVEGQVSRDNSRWIEIIPPKSARFYVSRDYIQNIGEASLFAQLEEERETIEKNLEKLKAEGRAELRKEFKEIYIEPTLTALSHMIQTDYAHYPEQIKQAESLKKEFEEDYTQKKIAYYETLARRVSDENPIAYSSSKQEKDNQITPKMASWHPAEKRLWKQWVKESGRAGKNSMDTYYAEELSKAVELRGVVENYDKQIKNKPGDFRLVDAHSGTPIAFLYSTKVNLQHYVGKEITVLASERPNNHFAFPAYFVHEVE